jgi:hypothetical protein
VLGQAFAEAGPPADLEGAILQGANLSGVDLRGMSLRGTDLRGATLAEAALAGADLTDKDLHAVDLTDADLTCAVLLGTDLTDAVLTGCRIHGVAAWDVKLSGAQQDSLVISAPDDAVITADGLEVGQFIYLLLKNAKLREVIDAVTAKAVLILGRFTEERMRVLNAMGDALRSRNLLPIIFDFEAPKHRDVKDTVQTLAHLSRFIIADLTDPRSVPQELATIVPLLPSVPVQPVIQEDQEPWSMFPTLRRYPWVLEPFRYASAANLVAALDAHVLAPAEAAVQQGRPER